MANTGLIFVPVPAPLTQSAIIISSSFVIAPKLGLKSEFPVDAAGAVACVNRMLDVLVSNGHFTSAPTINRLVLAAHSLPGWSAGLSRPRNRGQPGPSRNIGGFAQDLSRVF